MQKRVTLNIDDSVYNKFQKFCEENDIIISKRVERLMKQEVEENRANKSKDKKRKNKK